MLRTPFGGRSERADERLSVLVEAAEGESGIPFHTVVETEAVEKQSLKKSMDRARTSCMIEVSQVSYQVKQPKKVREPKKVRPS